MGPSAAERDNGYGTTTCSFQSGHKTTDVMADHLVMARPFSTLPEVDLTAPEDQGFLSGGVVSGERAATEVQHQV